MGMQATSSSTRRTPTRAERKARTREELIDAAERLFKRDGFHATSLDAIADEAGYTKGAVYSNFDGKEDLFFAVYERRVETRTAELSALGGSAESAEAGLKAAIATMRGRSEDGWMSVFFEFWAHVLRNPQHRERFAELHRRGLGPFVDAIRRMYQERGQDPELPVELLATANLALGNGMQLERLTRPDEIDIDAIQRVAWLMASPTIEGG